MARLTLNDIMNPPLPISSAFAKQLADDVMDLSRQQDDLLKLALLAAASGAIEAHANRIGRTEGARDDD